VTKFAGPVLEEECSRLLLDAEPSDAGAALSHDGETLMIILASYRTLSMGMAPGPGGSHADTLSP